MARHPKVGIAMAVNKSADSCMMTALWLIPLFPIVLLYGLLRFGVLQVLAVTRDSKIGSIMQAHVFRGLDPVCRVCKHDINYVLMQEVRCKNFLTRLMYRLFPKG
jgi:hypothetical protein